MDEEIIRPHRWEELGQTPQQHEADIQRSLEYSERHPGYQEQLHAMQDRITQSVLRVVGMKEEDLRRAVSANQQQTRSEPEKTVPRHTPVANNRYDTPNAKGTVKRAKLPEHTAHRRSTERHIERNLRRDARVQRRKAMKQRIQARAVAMVRHATRAIRDTVKAVQPVLRQQRQQRQRQAERNSLGRLQSMLRHRREKQPPAKAQEKVKVNAKAKARSQENARGPRPAQTPARQQQQSKGKGNDRGRSR